VLDPAPTHAATAGSAPVTIRPMRRDEAPRVGAITLASYDAHGTMNGPYRDFLADPLLRLDGSTELLVAERDAEVVGTITFVLPGDAEWEGRAQLDGDCAFRVLAVDPAAEGLGIGRSLVAACLDRSRALGRHRCLITSMSWMTRAHELYRRFGFVRRPDLDVRFPGGDGVTFTLDLTPQAPELFPPPGPVPSELPWYADVWAR
jgi:predicted N-acetyltransferase YhbS